MLRKMLGYFALSLLLLLSNSSGTSAPSSPGKSPEGVTGTLEKMIVANGNVALDLDLNRLNGLGPEIKESKLDTLRFHGVKGGTGNEGDTGKDAGADHGPYMEFQVEKPVAKIGGEAPEYPAALKADGVEGTVLAQFVVNESGRYESGTLKILNSSNPAFSAAVKDALPRMKFSAAQIGGKKVQQLVQMPFQFHIAH